MKIDFFNPKTTSTVTWIALLVMHLVNTTPALAYTNNFVKLGETYRVEFFVDTNSIHYTITGTKQVMMLMSPKWLFKQTFNMAYKKKNIYYIMNEIEVDVDNNQIKYLNLYAFDKNKKEVTADGVGDEMKFTSYTRYSGGTVMDRLIKYLRANYK